MNGKQITVMWLGLLLIAARLFTTDQWSELWSVFGSETKSSSSSSTPAPPSTTTQPPLMRVR